jgi:hypothetical protein
VLRRIFGPKRDEVTGPLCSVLFTKYYSGDKVKKTEMDRTCSTYGERRGVYRVLVGKPEGRRPLEDQGVDGKIILKWNFERLDRGA